MVHSSNIGNMFYPRLRRVLIPTKVSLPVSPDVPGGFSVRQREGPREGGDLHLTCVANKYLYTGLSWQRLNTTGDTPASGSALSSHQFTSREFSNSLVLLLNNLTARDSGTYRCSAHHLITGQETHLDTQVVVMGEWIKEKKQFYFVSSQ